MTLRCLPMGETALLVLCDDLATVRRLMPRCWRPDCPGFGETVPAYDSVLVIGGPAAATPWTHWPASCPPGRCRTVGDPRPGESWRSR